MYNPLQIKVLSVRPGLTDYASLQYFNESEILGASENAEELYIKKIMPDKLRLNLEYIEERGFLTDLRILLRTVRKIFS
jgi:lipopolysaccharide/colanic/teichoic acid biosynthesis glycosyltransferase